MYFLKENLVSDMHPTNHAVITLTEGVRRELDDGQFSCVV